MTWKSILKATDRRGLGQAAFTFRINKLGERTQDFRLEEPFEVEFLLDHWHKFNDDRFLTEKRFNMLLPENNPKDPKSRTGYGEFSFVKHHDMTYEQYLEKYRPLVEEGQRMNREFREMKQRRREKKAKEIRERRTPEYYRQTLPQRLRTEEE